jgi:hypothetical protein
MIFIVESGEGTEPRAWFAFDEADLLEKACASDALRPWEVWDCATARELLDLVDETPERPGVAERFPAMFALGEREGWDTPLYRADHLIGRGSYRPEPITRLDACLAALRSRGGELRVYGDETSALAAVDAPDPWFDNTTGWRARLALREQLIATEVLADGY